MSFLENAKIRTKILSLIVPVSLIGLGGVGAVSYNYKDADNIYSEFINKDTLATTDLFRANTTLVAVGYDTTLGLMMATQSTNAAAIEESYKKDVDTVLSRLASAKTSLPQISAQVDSLIAGAKEIFATTDKVWALAKAGNLEAARQAISGVSPQIDKWRAEVRGLSDQKLKDMVAGSDALTKQTNSRPF